MNLTVAENSGERALIVFDLDETLFHTRHLPLAQHKIHFWQAGWTAHPLDSLPPHAVMEDRHYRYSCYKRPGLDQFLRELASLPFEYAVWTSSTEEYARYFMQELFPSSFIDNLQFVWSRQLCKVKRSWLKRNSFFYKDLNQIVESLAFPVQRILMVDDTPQKLFKQPDNLQVIPAWTGQPQDDALMVLFAFFASLPENVNFQDLQKIVW